MDSYRAEQKNLEFHSPLTLDIHSDLHIILDHRHLFLANRFHHAPKQKIESLRYSQERFERLLQQYHDMVKGTIDRWYHISLPLNTDLH